MLTFDGNTAPYLQYAYSRIRAIFRKATTAPGKIVIRDEAEDRLATKLQGFGETVVAVGQKGLPNLLCNYLFELADCYMHFYEHCPVLKDGVDEETRKSRLALCELTARVLKQGLNLLGINVMEQM